MSIRPQWQLLPAPDPAAVQGLAEALQLDPALASVLVQRGIGTYAEAEHFFAPSWASLHDPYLMADMPQAVARIQQAIAGQQRILVYGDYDVDGSTAVALVSYYFSQFGIDHLRYIPDRATEGYGLSRAGVEYALANACALIITLDCGIKEIDNSAYAASLGIDLIVCDHHVPGEALPTAVAVLNPKRPDCLYPFKELPGCGIGFKLLQALDADLGQSYDFTQLADLVTLAIASDIVPILGENRVIAHYGLKKLRENPLPGIARIMALAARARRWDVSDIVFFIGPRINAMGRMQHALHAVDVLLGVADADRETDQAHALEEANTARKTQEREMLQQAVLVLEADEAHTTRKSIVLGQAGWHKGIVGIVAAKLVDRYYKPTILLTLQDGQWVGSARSVAGFDVHAALTACAHYLDKFGGHRYAAGLSLAAEKLDDFVAAFEDYCQLHVQPDQQQPLLPIDAVVSFRQITPKFVRIVQRMEPFGPGNMHPVWAAAPVQVRSWRVVGGQHLKLRLQQGNIILDAIAFGMATPSMLDLVQSRQALAIAFYPVINHYNGQASLQLNIKDLLPAQVWLERYDTIADAAT